MGIVCRQAPGASRLMASLLLPLFLAGCVSGGGLEGEPRAGAPTIELRSREVQVDAGSSYDPGENVVAVLDPEHGAMRFVPMVPLSDVRGGCYTIEGELDLTTPGTYHLTVAAADLEGYLVTREFSVCVKGTSLPAPDTSSPVGKEGGQEEAVRTYVVNRNTGVFHDPGCSSVDRMSENNRLLVTDSRAHLQEEGYRPCGVCRP